MRCQGLDERPARRLTQVKRSSDSLRHQIRLGERGQVDEPDAVLVAPDEFTGHRQGQAGFAGAAGTGQRQQARAVQQAGGGRDLPFPANKGGQLVRQIAARHVGIIAHLHPWMQGDCTIALM